MISNKSATIQRRSTKRPPEATRRILFVTGSRGEWGYIRPILRLIKARRGLSYSLVVTNMHLLPEFGASAKEITGEGWHVDQEIYMALDGYIGTSMTKSLGVFLLSIVDTLHRIRPDIIVLAGDRGEQLMTALAGAHLNIPVAHIQAGEVSGNIDGMTRHAMARFVHLHFTANDEAAQRLRRSGEQDFRIVTVGAPQLDELLQVDGLTVDRVTTRFHLDRKQPVVLLVQHPVTEQIREAGEQMETTLRALATLHHQTVLIYPNNDAGSTLVREAIDAFRAPWLRVVRNVSREDYAGLLRIAGVLVGNSSSGIIEAPSFELPAVNIGRRQAGRVQALNVLNVDHDERAIRQAVQQACSPAFRASLKKLKNPYGDGHASERIIERLATIPLDERLLFKELAY